MKRRIFVIDDELPVLEGVQHIIESSFPEGEVCGTGRSGVEALKKLSADPPDILLVDIHLPGISGLEIVSEVKRRNPEVLCIIISAYEQFNIAREALDFGVFAYIVKPVTKSRLLKVLQKAAAALDQEQQQQEEHLYSKVLRQSVESLLESEFIQRVFSGVWKPDADLWQQWIVALRSLRPDFFPRVRLVRVSLPEGIQSRDTDRKMAIALRYKVPCWTGVIAPGSVGVLVASENEKAVSMLSEAARELMHLAGAGIGLEPQIDCSTDFSLERLWEFLPQFLSLFSKSSQSSVESRNIPALRVHLQQLWPRICSRDNTGLSVWRSDCLSLLTDVLRSDGETARMLLLEPLYLAYQSPQVPPLILSSLAVCASAEEMLDLLISRLQDALRTGGEETVESRTLQTAIDYIRGNFGRQLSLDDAAGIAGVSAAHLSRLFRQELQLSFSDYVTSLRMEYARKLLERRTYSIKEISELTGYYDSNYFSRVFKRWVGLRPSEYAEKHLVED
ncbi:response regulator [Spirochaeta dissipatitropha]